MNIDFSKLKNMDLKDIHLKDLKNKKELLILLGIIIFVIAILLIGNSLLTEHFKAREELDRLKSRYKTVSAIESVEVLSTQIEDMNNKLASSEVLTQPLNKLEILEILREMQQELGITWEQKDRTIADAAKVEKTDGIWKFRVTIDSFKADYEKAKEIMAYVQNLERKASIDSFTVKKNALTGEFRGSMILNFYMQEESANSEV